MQYIEGFIRVESVIEELDDSGIVESSERHDGIFPARITERDGVLIALYREDSDGGSIESTVKIGDDFVSVERGGAITSHFNFRGGMKEKSLYKVGSYAFDAEIYTKKIRNNVTRPYGSVHILYDMTLGGAKKAVRMKITLSEDRE